MVFMKKTQLKSLAKTTEAINTITTILSDTTLTDIEKKKDLTIASKAYSLETLKSAMAQSTLNREQIEAILIENGLQGELLETTADELANAASTNAVAASQKAAAASTLEFGTSLKGLGISIRKLAAAHPILTAISLAGVTLFGITKVIKHFTVSLKEQQEITQNLQGELSEIQSDISDVNSELQTTSDRIDELSKKDSLSFVEKEELENLTAQNEELERRNRLLKEQEAAKQQEVAESVQREFNKEYGNRTYGRILAQQQIDEMVEKRARYNELYINNGYNTEEEQAEQERLKQELNVWDSSSSTFSDHIQETIAAYESLNQRIKEGEILTERETNQLADYRKELVDYNVDLEDYISRYGIDDEISQSWKDLSNSIYECLYPAEYLTEKFNETFNGLSENVQTELKELARDGSLSVEDLSENMINKFSEAGFSASEVIQQLLSEYEALSDSASQIPSNSPLSISETVDQIDTRLKPALSSLQSIYQEIFSLDENTGKKIFTHLDEADITDKFKPVLDALRDLDEIDGVKVDYSAYEDFVSVLSDTSSNEDEVQEKFDKLATSIIYASDCTNMSAESFNLLAESLTEMGVTNAYEMLGKIRDAQEELAELTYDADTAILEEGNSLKGLALASVETEEYLRHYLLKKELTQNPLSTFEDFMALENLCNALEITGEMYEAVNSLRAAFESKERGNHSEGIEEAIKTYQQRVQELANGYGYEYFKINFDKSETVSSRSGSSAKDTTENFDWTTTAIDHVEEEIEALDEVANSAYSTFSQKNEALAQEIDKISEEIDLQQQAYTDYMNRAEAVGLSDHYKNLIQNGSLGMEDITDETLQNQISEYQKWYNKAQDVSKAIKDLNTDMKDLYVSAYELQTGNLKERLDSDSITQKQYLDGLKEAYEKFYADLEDFAEQYHKAVLEYLAEEKNYLNSVAGAAASLLDTEIDNIQEDAESQEELIQRQIDLLEAKKKPLQDELDALEDKAKRENLILNLQKAQYELARSENQRTKLVYKDGQMVYSSDPAAIADAKKEVDDARLEIQKQSIEDRIDALDHEIDKYNDLIDQINHAADTQIDALEKIKRKWQEVTDQQEYGKNVTLLTGEFGTSAVTKILTGNDDDLLERWKNNYINTLAGIDMESQGYIGDMTGQLASLYDVDLSSLQSQFQNVTSSISEVTGALGKAASAVGIGSNAPTDLQDAEGEPVSNNSLSDSVTNLGMISNETLPAITSNMEEIAETATNASFEVSHVADAINNIPESKDVTISVHTVGVGSISGGASSQVSQAAFMEGNTYASGTRRAEKGLALVGEEKPEVIITNDKKAFLAKEPTLLHMEGGETVFDGNATAKMLEAKGFRPITADEFPLLKAFSSYSPDEIRQKFAPNLASPAKSAASSAMQNANHAVNNSSVNNGPSYTMTGDVHIHCPGVTKDEVAKQIGSELNNVFNGLSLKAYQRANITR